MIYNSPVKPLKVWGVASKITGKIVKYAMAEKRPDAEYYQGPTDRVVRLIIQEWKSEKKAKKR